MCVRGGEAEHEWRLVGAGEVNSETSAVVASTYIVGRRSTCCSPRARSGWAVNCSCDTQQ